MLRRLVLVSLLSPHSLAHSPSAASLSGTPIDHVRRRMSAQSPAAPLLSAEFGARPPAFPTHLTDHRLRILYSTLCVLRFHSYSLALSTLFSLFPLFLTSATKAALCRQVSSRQFRTQILTGEPFYPHFPLADLYRFCRIAIPWHGTRFTLLLIDRLPHRDSPPSILAFDSLRQVCIDLAPLCIQHLSAPTIILFTRNKHAVRTTPFLALF